MKIELQISYGLTPPYEEEEKSRESEFRNQRYECHLGIHRLQKSLMSKLTPMETKLYTPDFDYGRYNVSDKIK